MSSFDWKSFLLHWSQAILEMMDDKEKQQLPQEVLDSGWLGYPGATDEQIERLEARLKRQLPPSYRDFLKVTNGWRQTARAQDSFNHKLWSTDVIGTFIIRHPRWINAFTERHETADISLEDPDELDDYWNPVGVSDDDYLVYGEDQDPSRIRVEYLRTAIEISDVGIDSIYLLNSQIVTPDGEWEAWFFADYLPGADRYRSFRDMMEAEYANFLELRDAETNVPKATADAKLPLQQLMLKASDCSVGLLTAGDPEETRNNRPSALKAGVTTSDWQSLKRLIIDYQSRQTGDQAEYRTVASAGDLDQVEVWPDLIKEPVQRWLQQHLTEAERSHSKKVNAAAVSNPPTAPKEKVSMQSRTGGTILEKTLPVSEETIVAPEREERALDISLEILGLAIHQPSNPGNQILVRSAALQQSNQLRIGSLSSQSLFSIGVEFRLNGQNLDTLEPQTISYKAQFFVQNRITHQSIELGETPPESLEKRRSTYTATLFNQALAPGMYRMQVVTSLSGGAMALDSFELPLLTVT